MLHTEEGVNYLSDHSEIQDDLKKSLCALTLATTSTTFNSFISTSDDKIMINIELENFLCIEEALSRALEEFNELIKNKGLKISTDFSNYRLRLAKKSGRPNLDLPPVVLLNKISSCKITRFAVEIESNHVLSAFAPQEVSRASRKAEATFDNKEEFLLLENEVKKKRKCCQSCLTF